MNAFFQSISERQTRLNSFLCVGLDPEPSKFPEQIERRRPVKQFCLDVIDSTSDAACCFKPRFAHFAAADALDDLRCYCSPKGAVHFSHLRCEAGNVGSTTRTTRGKRSIYTMRMQ